MRRKLLIVTAAAVTALAGAPGLVHASQSEPRSNGAGLTHDSSVTALEVSAQAQVTQARSAVRNFARGTRGNVLRVSKVRNLPAGGSYVTVSGSGFNETVGIYVGLCRTPRRGVKPSPCGGGVDTTGRTQASAWISSNPPPYGRTLAKPYGRGGTFKVRIYVRSQINATTNCRRVSCSIVTRADHLRSNDRRWDLAVPVRFR